MPNLEAKSGIMRAFRFFTSRCCDTPPFRRTYFFKQPEEPCCQSQERAVQCTAHTARSAFRSPCLRAGKGTRKARALSPNCPFRRWSEENTLGAVVVVYIVRFAARPET